MKSGESLKATIPGEGALETSNSISPGDKQTALTISERRVAKKKTGRIVTLTRNNDFRRLYRAKSIVSPILVTYLQKNRFSYNRVGITATKKIGNAVQRNRSRRVIREAYRALAPRFISTGYDIVFVARSGTSRVPMNDVLAVMAKQLKTLLFN